MDLGQAVQRIKNLEEEVGVKEDVIKKLETDLDTARHIADIAKGKADSLEVQNEDNKTLAKKYKVLAKLIK